ncbi:ABC1 kinase family protein [Nitrosophilus kaiyonis]|uniref:ABC1 kinase family protein n=1 Tax=Nitrosophilus kaiyonis TaxID=2930200 RepID=UPI00248FF4A0|nr:AarF/UbiB family protein [Nitrosophilus kaiyonis]
MKKYYHPLRIYKIFIFLVTIFLLIKKKKRFLLFKPLKPKELKNTIIGLGASFIKLSQVLATRADFFSLDYINELKELHDELPPMNKEDFLKVYNRAFKDDIFSYFENKPIASASIGEVHKARLKSGELVAVKLRRYNIEKQVKADIKILNFFNNLFRPFFSLYTKNSIDAVISEFSKMILEEIDFLHEVKNLQDFSKTYKKSGVKFPKAYLKYCSENAIVMSFERGYRFDDRENLKRLNIDFYEIMNKLILFYTDQMLIRGYFHADPHPGNLLVNEDGQLILLDFGMVKKISNQTRIAIIELIKSANERDFELYIAACKRLGIIAYNAPQNLLEEFAQKMFDIFSDENLSSSSMQKLAFDLLSTTKELPFKLPQEAIFILRASAIIEGLGTTYIENFNGIKDILPVLQKHIPDALGAKERFFELIKNDITSFPLTHRRIKKIITDMSESAFVIHLSQDSIELFIEKIKVILKPILQGAVFIILSFYFLYSDFSYKEYISIIFLVFGIIRLIFI